MYVQYVCMYVCMYVLITPTTREKKLDTTLTDLITSLVNELQVVCVEEVQVLLVSIPEHSGAGDRAERESNQQRVAALDNQESTLGLCSTAGQPASSGRIYHL